jgi:ubiquinone biosynthesis O-methyltransferase
VDVMAIFNEFASEYDSWYNEKKGSFIDKVETDSAFQMLKMSAGMKVLDVGCGTGNFSIKLAKSGCHVTGIDVSEEMLLFARAKASEQNIKIHFLNMDAQNLQFPDNEFDMVISMAAIEFINDIPKALEEIFRVVKVGGQVLIGTINGDSDWGKLYKSEEVSKNSVFQYANFKTLDDIKELKPKNILKTGECLFISPFADEDEFNIERENELAGKRKGGYICALWKK